MPTSSPPPMPDHGSLLVGLTAEEIYDAVRRSDPLFGIPGVTSLTGLTADEALERLERLDQLDPPARPRPLLGRLWTRVRQAWCSHPAATAVRIPAAIRPVFRRHCARCDKRWSEVG